MNMMDEIYRKAKANVQTVAFPETDEEKILKAAVICRDDGICRPLLVGAAESISGRAAELGLDISGIEIADCSDEKMLEELFSRYAPLNTEMTEKAMKRKAKDPLYVALMLEAVGDADATFAGLSHTTGEVIWAGQMIIGLEEGISTVSSIGIAEIPGYEGSEGNLLVIGDSAVCANPTAEDLAGIAVSACDTAKTLLGWEPRCAMLSFSTDGSAENELVDKVRDAVALAKKMKPDYNIDGEFQLDAAINPAVAAKKVKRESSVAGRANVLIWPDLNVGNIGVKLLQQFAHADAYGPVLQGFRKVVCDCSRGAPVSELIGNIAISAVRAQGVSE